MNVWLIFVCCKVCSSNALKQFGFHLHLQRPQLISFSPIQKEFRTFILQVLILVGHSVLVCAIIIAGKFQYPIAECDLIGGEMGMMRGD